MRIFLRPWFGLENWNTGPPSPKSVLLMGSISPNSITFSLHFPSLLAFSASLAVRLPRRFSDVSTSLLLHSQHTLVKAPIIFLLD